MTRTVQPPATSIEPMKIARYLLHTTFQVDPSTNGLVQFGGDFFHWYGNRWCLRDRHWLEDMCWKALEDLEIQITDNGTKRFSPTPAKIEGVVRALESQIRVDRVHTPAWLGPSKKSPDEYRTIAFQDKLVTVTDMKIRDRTQHWFDTSLIPCTYNPNAECPRFFQCLEEWGDDDPTWGLLLQRWFGYCLLGHRNYAKWLLMQGKIRSGKGTIAKILRKLMGSPAFLSCSLEDLADQYGLDGMEHSRVLCVSEVSDLLTKDAEKAVRVLKNILGQDPLTINAKYKRQLRNITVNAAPMMQANSIPRLPNKARGLSGKMLVLPFNVSFAGNEDPNLYQKLEREIEGIAAWAIIGARELEAETNMALKFPEPDSAAENVHLYHMQNNPTDHFLMSRFIPNPTGFVPTSIIKIQWYDWIKRNDIRLHIATNQIARTIEMESSWDIKRIRKGGSGIRGLAGISLKKASDDEI